MNVYFASYHTNIQNIREKNHIFLLFSGVQSHFPYMWMSKQDFCITVPLCSCVMYQQSWLALISYKKKNGRPVSLDFQNLNLLCELIFQIMQSYCNRRAGGDASVPEVE